MVGLGLGPLGPASHSAQQNAVCSEQRLQAEGTANRYVWAGQSQPPRGLFTQWPHDLSSVFVIDPIEERSKDSIVAVLKREMGDSLQYWLLAQIVSPDTAIRLASTRLEAIAAGMYMHAHFSEAVLLELALDGTLSTFGRKSILGSLTQRDRRAKRLSATRSYLVCALANEVLIAQQNSPTRYASELANAIYWLRWEEIPEARELLATTTVTQAARRLEKWNLLPTRSQ